MSECKYKRVILKLSGEALAGVNGFGLDINVDVYKRQIIYKGASGSNKLMRDGGYICTGIEAVSYTHLI